MNRKRGATYIDASDRPVVKSLKNKLTRLAAGAAAALTLITGIGVGALALDANTTRNVTAADAGWALACSDVIGGSMDERRPWGGMIAPVLPEAQNRSFTLNEISANPIWTNYTGIGDGSEHDFFVTPYKDVLAGATMTDTEKTYFDDGTYVDGDNSNKLSDRYATAWAAGVEGKLKGERSTANCFGEQIFILGPANWLGLGFANAIQGFVSWVAVSVFNADFFCDPNSTSASCDGINLVQVIGGTDDASYRAGGSDGGLIGTLTDSIYKPLVIIIVVLTALTILYTGIIKRQFRQALGQAAWLGLSFVIGLALLLNPNLVAKAPMVVTNTITGCVIGAFNGDNCFDGTSGGSTVSATGTSANEAVCISDANVTPDQKATLAVNSMGCTIWKTFILQNYAHGAFGLDLNQLDTLGNGTVADDAVAAAGLSGNDFCYYLSTNGSAEGYKNGTITTNTSGAKICNLAVFNILMQLNVTPAGDSSVKAQYDPDWYNLIMTTASNDQMWHSWTVATNQFIQGFVAVISVIAGGFIIVLTSFLALMYYITAVLLLIFAPLFVLIGLHPGRGKKIMLGWMETILSSLLKYLASAVFLLVALALYSAVIGSANPFAALLFVIILSIVLFMYRKEIVDMFGKVNLGGEKMSSMMDKNIPLMGASANDLRKKAEKVPGAMVGGAIGGLLAGGVSKMGEGARIARQNELRSAPGLIGRAAQAKQRQLQENKADQNRITRNTGNEAAAAANKAEAANARAGEATQDRQDAEQGYNEELEKYDQMLSDRDELDEEALKLEQENVDQNLEIGKIEVNAQTNNEAVNAAADAVASRGDNYSQSFAEFQKLSNEIANLALQRDLATDEGEKNQYNLELARVADARTEISEDLRGTPELESRWNEEMNAYNAQLDFELSRRGMIDDYGNAQRYSHDEHREAVTERDNINTRIENNEAEKVTQDVAIEAKFESLNELHADITQMGDVEQDRIREARKLDAQAQGKKAEAEALEDMYLELGPGNLPNAHDMDEMKRKARKAGKLVESAMLDADAAIAGDLPEPAKPRNPFSKLEEKITEGRIERAEDDVAEAEEKRNKRQATRAQRMDSVGDDVDLGKDVFAVANRERHAAKEREKQAVASAANASSEVKTTEKALKEQQQLLAASEQQGNTGSSTAIREEMSRLQSQLTEQRNKLEAAEKARQEAVEDGKAAKNAMAQSAGQVATGAVGDAASKVRDKVDERLENREQAKYDARAEKLKERSGVLTAKTAGLNNKGVSEDEKNRLTQLVNLADKLFETGKQASSEEKRQIAILQETLTKVASSNTPTATEKVVEAVKNYLETNPPKQGNQDGAPANRSSSNGGGLRLPTRPVTDSSNDKPTGSGLPRSPKPGAGGAE